MRVLVTGSAGHLGEALVRTLISEHEVVGLDIIGSKFTTVVGTITDRTTVERCVHGIDVIFHTATLHKPHIVTHTRQQFIDANVTGTLNLLEASVEAGVNLFIFTSTTSTFGRALTPSSGEPAGWINEQTPPLPRNIYGVSKTAAEDLCELFHIDHGLACIVLKTSRFFPEADDSRDLRQTYEDENIKANEYLYRRVDIEDVVKAHILAMERATSIGFGRYVISATTPFTIADLVDLRAKAPVVVERIFPEFKEEYERRGWKMFPSIDRVYVNKKARTDLGWNPRYNFDYVLDRLRSNEEFRSALSITVGSKGYHAGKFADGPYPME
jgi:nucleoside-diphosphate-sugar epimerase